MLLEMAVEENDAEIVDPAAKLGNAEHAPWRDEFPKCHHKEDAEKSAHANDRLD